MGLLDNPLGFFFGNKEEKGVIDTRAPREPEGQRFWERWDQVFNAGGPMDPMNTYPMALAGLNQLMGWRTTPGSGYTPPANQMPKPPLTNNGVMGDGGGQLGGNANAWDAYHRERAEYNNFGEGPDPVLSPPPNPANFRQAGPDQGLDKVRALPVGTPTQFDAPMVAAIERGQPGQAPAGGPGVGLLSETLANAPVNVNFGGQGLSFTPRWARRLPFQYAAAISNLMNPWMQGGLTLEQGRKGTAYHTPEDFGYFGDLQREFGTNVVGTLGKGVGGYGYGKMFG